MIKSILILTALVFSFSSTAFAGHHEAKKDGMKKIKKVETAATDKKEDKKADADAALKKVEAMTKDARAKGKGMAKDAKTK